MNTKFKIIFYVIFLLICIFNSNIYSEVYYSKKVGFFNADSLLDTLVIKHYSKFINLPSKFVLSEQQNDSTIIYNSVNFEFKDDSIITIANVIIVDLNNDFKSELILDIKRDSLITDSLNNTKMNISTYYFLPNQNYSTSDTINILATDSIQITPYKSLIMTDEKGIHYTTNYDINRNPLVILQYQDMMDYLEELPPTINVVNEGQNYLNCSLYPNPAKDILNIQLNQNSFDEVSDIFFIDILGNIQRRYSFFERKSLIKFDVSDLPSGLYYIKMCTNQKKKIFVQPILIIH